MERINKLLKNSRASFSNSLRNFITIYEEEHKKIMEEIEFLDNIEMFKQFRRLEYKTGRDYDYIEINDEGLSTKYEFSARVFILVYSKLINDRIFRVSDLIDSLLKEEDRLTIYADIEDILRYMARHGLFTNEGDKLTLAEDGLTLKETRLKLKNINKAIISHISLRGRLVYIISTLAEANIKELIEENNVYDSITNYLTFVNYCIVSDDITNLNKLSNFFINE